ncbi:hypothetical protein QN277_006164 [Acacia crassicarpa]|uniref:Uncharacterized protein n=1 Tax=Acacia crassicarpa TaxID=499986 RepID=A0AAE1IZG3_9FABA|nr:hypothetical protein QN277_006164 [Acacia crassicarpa]
MALNLLLKRNCSVVVEIAQHAKLLNFIDRASNPKSDYSTTGDPNAERLRLMAASSIVSGEDKYLQVIILFETV